VILYCGLVLLARATDGRVGILCVVGDSMEEVPWGSHVLILPLRAREGDLVCARLFGVDDPEVSEDLSSSLVIKRLGRGFLVSSVGIKFHKFELRGRIAAVIPFQRIFPWASKGAANKPFWTPREGDYRRAMEREMEKKEREKEVLVNQGMLIDLPLPKSLTDLDRETGERLAGSALQVEWEERRSVRRVVVEVRDVAGGEIENMGKDRIDLFLKTTGKWRSYTGFKSGSSEVVLPSPEEVSGIRIVPKVSVVYIDEVMVFVQL